MKMSRPPFASCLLLCLLLPVCLLAEADAQKRLGHLEAFGRQGPNSGIDQVDGFLPPKDFFDNYVLKNRPLLFKGAAKRSPAFKLWTDEYLAERTPARPAGDVFVEHSKKENRSQNYNFMHFKEFLRVYKTSNIYMVSELPNELLKDLVVPFSLQCKSFLTGHLDTYVTWFSSGGTSSVIHHDSYENINCLYRGRKTLVFVNTTRYPDESQKIIDKDDGAFSSVDVDRIDLDKRPEFAGIEYQVGEMETGDCLYIPYLWVHQVRSFDNNLAVNLWWPLKRKYDLSSCSKEYNLNVTFDKVLFKTLEEQKMADADTVRQAIAYNVKTVDSFADFLKSMSAGNAEVAGKSEFVEATRQLYEALDMDKDGKITNEDFNLRMKRKHYKPLVAAADNYNSVVHRIAEAAKSAADSGDSKLPKLLKTSVSDEEFFAIDRTMPLPPEFTGYEEGGEPAPEEDEPAPEENEPAPEEDEPAPEEDEPAPEEDEPAPGVDETVAGSEGDKATPDPVKDEL